MVDVSSFLSQYLGIILFYAALVLFVAVKWKKIDVQAKIIFLYRTKWGLGWMSRFSSRSREWVILAGYAGVGIGFIGMLVISWVLLKNLYELIVNPTAVSGVSLVLPGVNVPGMGVLPFWYWLVAIFVIAVVHEFSHGIVARAHNVTVKNTGIVLLGPIIGAFVEPNEKKLRQEKDIVQYSILAAGSFSNILLAIFALLALTLVFTPLQQTMVQPTGFTFDAYVPGDYPFSQAGIAPGTLITGINGQSITEFQQFSDKLTMKAPGDIIKVQTTEQSYDVTLAQNPDNPQRGFLGIAQIRNKVEVKDTFKSGILNPVYIVVDWVTGFLRWLFLLSLGIGLFNLLPLPIVDGGRMAQVFLHKWKGRLVGEKRYRQVGLFFLLVLVLNLIAPLIMKLF